METPKRVELGWPRAAALFLMAWLASPVVGGTMLIGVVYLIMMVGLPVRRASAYLAAAILAWGVFQGERAGMWWTERGWAVLVGGWFVALTLRRPESGFLSRALASVAGAVAVAAGLVVATGGAWSVLDWQMTQRVRGYFAAGMEAVRVLQERGTLSPAVVVALYAAAETQVKVFPATLALATLAALAVAWWLYVRMAHGDDQALLPLREFRFNDQLVWLFIGGLALTLVGGDGLKRAGSNAVVFMGALYALRGAAVVSFFAGGQSPLTAFLLLLGLVFVAPVMMVGALVIGIGDTWLDLRARARAMTA
ncbi:MAG: DUF2232 domain-containing protein [Gemmatimonadetes bacterium]|nr:DUF2232 domain-containing protein [Gemmatimonadota bacterium]